MPGIATNGQLNGSGKPHLPVLERIKPIDTPEARWYPIQEIKRMQVVYCRGVNTILRQLAPAPALMEWIKTNGLHADAIRDRRAGEGRQVHSAAEILHSGGMLKADNYPPHVWKAILSYRRWREDHEPKLIDIEKTVFSTKFLLAGTFDQLNEHEDGLRIEDIKFTKYVYDENFRQAQTYAFLANSMGIPVKKVGIVQVGAKTKQGYSYRTQDYDPAVFNELVIPLLEVFDYLHKGQTGPRQEQLPDTLKL